MEINPVLNGDMVIEAPPKRLKAEMDSFLVEVVKEVAYVLGSPTLGRSCLETEARLLSI